MKYKNYILLALVLVSLILLIVFSSNTTDRNTSSDPEQSASTSTTENAELPQKQNQEEENVVSEPDQATPTTPPAAITPPTRPTQTFTAPQPQTPTTTITPAPPQPLTALESAIQGDGSQRCMWVDKDSGADEMALIKDGTIRLTTKENSEDIFFTLYNSLATYTWKEGEKSGIIIVDDTHPTASKVLYETKEELANYLTQSNRVKCDSASLSDTHFEVPSEISFVRLDG